MARFFLIERDGKRLNFFVKIPFTPYTIVRHNGRFFVMSRKLSWADRARGLEVAERMEREK